MSSINLTRDEARARTALLEVTHYDVHLDVTSPGPTFRSTTTVELIAKESGATFIDLRDADVLSVTLDGVDVTEAAKYTSETGVSFNVSAGSHVLVVDADCRYTTTGQGLHRFVDPADNETYLYSQFETADAKRVFACFDQPDLKATYTMRVVAPEGWTVVSNSGASVTENAAAEGTSTWAFEVAVPLSTYLIAFCIGPWYGVHDEWRGEISRHPETPEEHQPDGELVIPLALYCRKSLAEHMDTERLFQETKEGFDYYAENFGEPYPFGKYDQIFCPEFNFGAMEHAGAVTIRDEYIFRSRTTGYVYERRNDTILHEMAHMWFGDLVTMQWWDDLWLNESFATWTAAAAQVAVSEYKEAWTTFANVEKAWAYQQDMLPSTHPIAADAGDIDTVEQNFDGITYAKGASVLKQLVAYVGEDAFLAGARLHFARHRFANATFDDLLSAMSETSGRDLSGWAQQWLTTTGVNTLAAEFTVGENGTYDSFAIRQHGAQPGVGDLRDHRIAVGLYERADSGAIERVRKVELDISGELTEVPDLIGARAADLVLANDDDLTYALLELDPRSLETLITGIANITDPMPRTLAWSAAWQMTRGGRMRARDFVRLVAEGAPTENQISVLERILAQAVQAVTSYADPEWSTAEGIKTLSDALLSAARTSEPGSDNQLAFINSLAQLPLAPEVAGTEPAEVFTAIRAGSPDSVGLTGLAVDAEMTWKALIALVAAGVAAGDGEEGDVGKQIDEAEAEDNSSQGAVSAIKARAAVPNATVKAKTWQAMTGTGEAALTNLQLRHMMAGFQAPGSSALLVAAGYTDRFFDEAAGWWSAFSSDTADRMLEGLYPMWDLSESAVDAAQRVLDDEATPSPVRRVLSEGQDRVRRALTAQAFDRT